MHTWQPTLPPAPILVVEDDPDTRLLLRDGLTHAGLSVTAVAGGRAALTWLEDTRPALVLLDLGLPDLTGQAVAEGLRARYGPGVPLLVVTGAAHPLEGAAEARALVYVRKPFTIAELLVAVRALLSAAADCAESATPAAAH